MPNILLQWLRAKQNKIPIKGKIAHSTFPRVHTCRSEHRPLVACKNGRQKDRLALLDTGSRPPVSSQFCFFFHGRRSIVCLFVCLSVSHFPLPNPATPRAERKGTLSTGNQLSNIHGRRGRPLLARDCETKFRLRRRFGRDARSRSTKDVIVCTLRTEIPDLPHSAGAGGVCDRERSRSIDRSNRK